MLKDINRRRIVGSFGAALLLPAARIGRAAEHEEEEVEALEDLMREHGVLRRALLVYAEAATRLERGKGNVSRDALRDTAALFRSFGEDYHERVEEEHVFPPLLEAGGRNATLVKTLKQQHERGREITDYISTVSSRGRSASANGKVFGNALTSFVRMYAHHAAIEDTIIFPAWKAAISEEQYQEMSEKFEEIEQHLFGEDGFEDAVARIAKIEQAFGLADLSKLTAPPPPKPA